MRYLQVPQKSFWHTEKKFCRGILRNKFCLFCLFLLTLIFCCLIGIKVYVTSILSEIEEISFNSTLEFKSQEIPEEIRKAFVFTLAGFDYMDRPVWIFPFGKWDIKKFVSEGAEQEKLLRIYADQCLHRLWYSLTLRNSSDWGFIADMDGYSYGQLTSLSTIKFLLQMLKKYRPVLDTLAYGYTVNLDYFAESFVSLMRPIAGAAFDKIEMFGGDKEEYFKNIPTKIPPSQIPQEYGGVKDFEPVAVYG